ncbi:hypothetical protein HCN44_009697 [Aphidius gifuensis]|uniref:DM10 domain-containing protein n=1 Tax=Aphidius gifuensis TaxID=684658 RepID=A0A835CWF9_APHGI|nr:nucleoside diphosphate kinase 7 [Aphidius gifuensis]KAF7998299.1 hypothetical protein HCN44_009697 [Aphidius gifuensis]
MTSDMTERLAFEAEWFDSNADLIKKFYLYFYTSDCTIELFDIKNKKTFLRRTKCENVDFKDFFVGNVVTIFSRAMKLVDVADSATKNKIGKIMEKTFAILKPDVINKMGEIIKTITAHDLHIANIMMVTLSEQDVDMLYENNENIKFIKSYLTSGPSVLLTLLGNNAVTVWQDLMGSIYNSDGEKNNESTSLRARYGSDNIHDGFYGSLNSQLAEKELDIFFPTMKSAKKHFKNTATCKKCTCCVIKPHAVRARLTGNIIDDIQKAGFIISAIKQFHVDPINAAEFLEVYKGVLANYGAMVGELQSGPCIAMEIIHKDTDVNVQAEFRKLCGPMDPDIGVKVRPQTLRAKYGKDKIQNAIHCSDIPEDGILEVEYFFKILDE